MAHESACCPGQQFSAADDATDSERFGLPSASDLEGDPVLAGCCAEDLANMRRGDKIRQALLEADRSTARLKLQAQALPMPPESGSASPPLDSDDEEGDPVLAELRQQRLADLQRQAAERQQRQRHGHGALNDVAAAALLGQVEALEGPAVVHLAVPGCEACALLDEHLASLAHRHPGTFFARVAARRGEPLAVKLRMQDLPGLVCFRPGGAVVGRAALSQFGPPGCVVEEEVTAYLGRLRVLRGEPPAGGGGGARAPGGGKGRGEGSKEEDDDEAEEEEEEWRLKPCEECGRRYPHEHVRAVYGGGGGGVGGRRSSDSSGGGLED